MKSNPTTAAEKAPKKRSWVKRALQKILCMNVALHKENHTAYCERRIIIRNQEKIMAALKLPSPSPDEEVQPRVSYKHWNNKYVNWDCEVSEDDDRESGTEEDSEATASE